MNELLKNENFNRAYREKINPYLKICNYHVVIS